jgi:hypothetical protein
MKSMQMVALMIVVAVLAVGCATTSEQDIQLSQGGGMYSALDATAQVYSNPRAQAAVEDNPWRWLGFVMHPIGVFFDYAVNRPFFTLSSLAPDLFGYTSEDVMIDSQRRR